MRESEHMKKSRFKISHRLKKWFVYFYLPLIVFLIAAFLKVVEYDLDDYQFNFEADLENQQLIKYALANGGAAPRQEVSREAFFFQDLEDYYNEISQQYRSSGLNLEKNGNSIQATDKQGEEEGSIAGLEQLEQEVKLGDKLTIPLQALVQKHLDSQKNQLDDLPSQQDKKASAPRNLKNQGGREKSVLETLPTLQLKEVKDPLEEQKLLTYQNRKLFSQYNRPITDTQVFSENKFLSSPSPDNSVENTETMLSKLDLRFSKEKYYRFEIIRFNLVTDDIINTNDLEVSIIRGNRKLENVGGKDGVLIKRYKGILYGTFNLGYNPRPVIHLVHITSKSNPQWKGLLSSFEIVRRKVPRLQPGFSVVNLEYVKPLANQKVRGPMEQMGGYENLVEWVRYIDADALWVLAGQTTGWDKTLSPEKPWSSTPIKNYKLLSSVAKNKGIAMGAYVMSFYTPNNGKALTGYNPSLGYDSRAGRLYASKHVSLADQKRINDMASFAKTLQEDEEIDFIGFDFIRTGRADGYELGPRVVQDMNIKTPKGYESYSDLEKVKWFAATVENQANQNEIKKWRWWRAHRVATVINQIIQAASITKPVWVFTLGWRWGHEHGQDPYMFFDAGVMIDAVMLYEASQPMFSSMISFWPTYYSVESRNIMIGNATDVRLLDSDTAHPGIEYMRRMNRGVRMPHPTKLAGGMFMHDISRALWSRHRGLDVAEWAIIHGASTSEFRHDLGMMPYKAEIVLDKPIQGERSRKGVIRVENIGKKPLKNLRLVFSPTPVWEAVRDESPEFFALAVGEQKEFAFEVLVKEEYKNRESVLGFYLEGNDSTGDYRRYFFFTYYTNHAKLKNYISYLDNVK